MCLRVQGCVVDLLTIARVITAHQIEDFAPHHRVENKYYINNSHRDAQPSKLDFTVRENLQIFEFTAT